MPAKVATSQTVAGGAFTRKKRQILALNGVMACSSCEVKKERDLLDSLFLHGCREMFSVESCGRAVFTG